MVWITLFKHTIAHSSNPFQGSMTSNYQTLQALISPENICTYTCACDACHYASHSSSYLHPEQILLLPLTAPKLLKTHPQPGTQTHTFFVLVASWLNKVKRLQKHCALLYCMYKSPIVYMNNHNALSKNCNINKIFLKCVWTHQITVGPYVFNAVHLKTIPLRRTAI